ncbi:MAG: M3 family peptidase, partial [Salinimicrobium sediminis]|nr:M3 family peptidase [Salinimicrobium sediminis]
MTKGNPLLEPFDTAPFMKIKVEHYKPAIEEAIELARKDIAEITTSTEAPSFKNTIEKLDFAGEKLDRIT